MIITLKGANFSTSNIGQLDSWHIDYTLTGVTEINAPTSVKKDTKLTAAFQLNEGATFDSVAVTMNGNSVANAYSYDENTGKITITIEKVTGRVDITIKATGSITPEPDTPVTPDVPSSSVDLTTLKYEATSDVIYDKTTATFTSTDAGNILAKGLAAQTVIVQEALKPGMEIQVTIDQHDSTKFTVIGLDKQKTLSGLADTASSDNTILATPINIYMDHSKHATAPVNYYSSFISKGENYDRINLVDGARYANLIGRHIITFKYLADNTIKVYAENGEILTNDATMNSQWAQLNGVPEVYMCLQGCSTNVTYTINYFGTLC